MRKRTFCLLCAALPAAWLVSSCRERATGPVEPGGGAPDRKGGRPSSDTAGEGGGDGKPPREARDGDFVGMAIAEAERLAERRRLAHRVVMLDGQPRPATRDYRPDRVNFEVEGGRVVKVTRG